MIDCPICGSRLDVTYWPRQWSKEVDAFVLRAADIGIPCAVIGKIIGFPGETRRIAERVVRLRAARRATTDQRDNQVGDFQQSRAGDCEGQPR